MESPGSAKSRILSRSWKSIPPPERITRVPSGNPDPDLAAKEADLGAKEADLVQTREELLAWLCKITRNVAHDWVQGSMSWFVTQGGNFCTDARRAAAAWECSPRL